MLNKLSVIVRSLEGLSQFAYRPDLIGLVAIMVILAVVYMAAILQTWMLCGIWELSFCNSSTNTIEGLVEFG